VAEIVAAHGGNWLESRMARLGGQFAGIARVEVPATSAAAVRQALAALVARGLSVSVAGDATGSAATVKGTPALLELVGQDRPGIIHQITHVLAVHQVNVEELTTECVEAPMAGGILFQAKAEVLVPAGADMAGLRRDLEKIAGDLMVDLTFREAK